MDLGLKGKVAIVTGGTAGIGKAIVESLLHEGAIVSFCARSSEQVENRLAFLRQGGYRVEGFAGDVSDEAFLASFMDSSADRLGGLDLVVANTGGMRGGSLVSSTPADWAATYEMNVGYSTSFARLAIPHLESRGGGCIVFISSISGWKPAPTLQYGVAKAGLIYLGQALARHLAKSNIRVNTVSPGSVLYEGGPWNKWRDEDPQGFYAFVKREFPCGRLGTAEEIADVVTFVLSDKASWISGSNITVDGAQERPSASAW